jgi:hypothetical protein
MNPQKPKKPTEPAEILAAITLQYDKLDPGATLVAWAALIRGLGYSPKQAKELARPVRELAAEELRKSPPSKEAVRALDNDAVYKIAEAIARKARPRVQYWEGKPEASEWTVTGLDQDYLEWKKNKRYPISHHQTVYCSFLRIQPGGAAAEYVTGTEKLPPHVNRRALPAPRGWRWSRDFSLVRLADGRDYHPTGNECARGVRHIVSQALATFRAADKSRRVVSALTKQAQAKALATCKKAGRLVVTLEDSRAGGNCEEGTRRFAAAHSLPNPCPVSRLLKVVKACTASDAQRVRGAILAALRRAAQPQPIAA